MYILTAQSVFPRILSNMFTCPDSLMTGLIFVTYYLDHVLPLDKGLAYFWQPGGQTWDECRAYCEALHGQIVSLHTKEDYDKAVNFLQRNRDGTALIWIGLTLPLDKSTEADFRWVDGALLQWATWDDGDPNNMDRKKCVSIRMGTNRKYDTKFCQSKYGCFCEGKDGVSNGQHQVSGFEKITSTTIDRRVPFNVVTLESPLKCASHCMRFGKCHVFTYVDEMCSLFTPSISSFRLCLSHNCDTYVRKVH